MLRMPVKTLLAAIFLLPTLTGCHSTPPVQFGGTYAYGDPQEVCGQAEIYPENDSTLLFHLYVNRGAPSYNNGEIEGRVVVRDNKAEFRRRFDSAETECVLQFEFYGDSIRVVMPGSDCNCGFGHGVYADGTYLRTSSEIPQSYTTVAGDNIRFDQWQEQTEQPEQTLGSAYYDRIDSRFIEYFPDYVPGMPLERRTLLPQQAVVEYLSDLLSDTPYVQVYAIGRILGYRGLNLFICELDYTRPDEDTYDNHIEGNIAVLVYDKSGFALQVYSYTGEAERAMHQLDAHYYGEGGEWTLVSSFARDTTIVSTFHQSESESATGYQTPLINSERRRSVITPLGDMETIEITEQRYSSPFYDCKFLEAQAWDEVADEGFNQRYPTRDNSWQLTNEETGVFPVNLFFHIERIDGALTPVFTTSKSDNPQILSRYAVGRADNDAEVADSAPAPDVALISTSDGDLEVQSDGKFRLHHQ